MNDSIKKTISIISLITLLVLKLSGAAQVTDILFYKNEVIPINQFPLEKLLKQNHEIEKKLPKEKYFYSNCKRLWKCYYEIKNDSLFLIKITSCNNDSSIIINNIFDKITPNGVFVEWFTGSIKENYGELLYTENNQLLRKFNISIEINNGIIKSIEKKENPKPFGKSGNSDEIRNLDEKSIINFKYKNCDSTNCSIKEYIKENKRKINESNFKGKIIVEFSIEKDGSVSNIELLMGSVDCEECNKEAIRLIASMPKWEIKHSKNGINPIIKIPITFE